MATEVVLSVCGSEEADTREEAQTVTENEEQDAEFTEDRP